MPDRLFRDRRDAGRFLAGLLEEYRGRPDVVVLALPRGGVPVASRSPRRWARRWTSSWSASWACRARRNWRWAPSRAAASRPQRRRGPCSGIPPEAIQLAAAREARARAPRAGVPEGRPFPEVAGKVVILVDDGLATGSTMRAAIEAMRSLGRRASSWPCRPRRVHLPGTHREADEVVCATRPSRSSRSGCWYEDFSQTTDDEVRELLRAASGPRPAAGTAPGPTETPSSAPTRYRERKASTTRCCSI